jgi:phosphocarrier protein
MSGVVEKTVRITNKRGLHARAAAKFVKLVEEQAGVSITVVKDEASVCGSSIMGLLMLSASLHSEVRIIAEGENAQQALEALVYLVENRFGEEA